MRCCAVQFSLVVSCDTTAIPTISYHWLYLACIASIAAHSLSMYIFLQYLDYHNRHNELDIASGTVALSLVGIFTHTLSLAVSLSHSLAPTSEGHGTHVSGSVAGNSLGVFGEMDGMAPDAKISFFDIGNIHPFTSTSMTSLDRVLHCMPSATCDL
jgi:Subtilase family